MSSFQRCSLLKNRLVDSLRIFQYRGKKLLLASTTHFSLHLQKMSPNVITLASEIIKSFLYISYYIIVTSYCWSFETLIVGVFWESQSRTAVLNLSLSMYPLSISTDEHVSLKFPMAKRLSKITKIQWIFNRTFRSLEL